MLVISKYAVQAENKYLQQKWNGFELIDNVLESMLFKTPRDAEGFLKCKPIKDKNPKVVEVVISYYVKQING